MELFLDITGHVVLIIMVMYFHESRDDIWEALKGKAKDYKSNTLVPRIFIHNAEIDNMRTTLTVFGLVLFCIYALPPIPEILIGFILYLLGRRISIRARITMQDSWANASHLTRYYKPLVTHGVYSIVRHPLYIGLSISWMGLFIMSGLVHTRWYWVPALAVFLSVVMFYMHVRAEEKAMLARHGDKYEQYCQRVGKFFPRPGAKNLGKLITYR